MYCKFYFVAYFLPIQSSFDLITIKMNLVSHSVMSDCLQSHGWTRPEGGENGKVDREEGPSPSQQSLLLPFHGCHHPVPTLFPHRQEIILSKNFHVCRILTFYSVLWVLLLTWSAQLWGGTSLYLTMEEPGTQRGQVISSRPHSWPGDASRLHSRSCSSYFPTQLGPGARCLSMSSGLAGIQQCSKNFYIFY